MSKRNKKGPYVWKKINYFFAKNKNIALFSAISAGFSALATFIGLFSAASSVKVSENTYQIQKEFQDFQKKMLLCQNRDDYLQAKQELQDYITMVDGMIFNCVSFVCPGRDCKIDSIIEIKPRLEVTSKLKYSLNKMSIVDDELYDSILYYLEMYDGSCINLGLTLRKHAAQYFVDTTLSNPELLFYSRIFDKIFPKLINYCSPAQKYDLLITSTLDRPIELRTLDTCAFPPIGNTNLFSLRCMLFGTRDKELYSAYLDYVSIENKLMYGLRTKPQADEQYKKNNPFYGNYYRVETNPKTIIGIIWTAVMTELLLEEEGRKTDIGILKEKYQTQFDPIVKDGSGLPSSLKNNLNKIKRK